MATLGPSLVQCVWERAIVLSFTKEYVIQAQTGSIFLWAKGGTTYSDFSTRQLFLNFHNFVF